MKTVSSLAVSLRLPPLLQKWCTWTSPIQSSQPYWRQELASLVMPIDMLLVAFALPAARTNPPQFVIMVLVICTIAFALFLKRRGFFLVAGLLTICSIEIGVTVSFLSAHEIGVSLLPLYALLVQPGFVVVAFFAPVFIFVLLVVNIGFIFISLFGLRLTPELSANLLSTGPDIVFPMINVQIFVALITWILISTLIRAILRADRAEDILRLERIALEQQERELAFKQQLEEGIQVLVLTLSSAVSRGGNFSVRVPLMQENILWRVGTATNNLLARLQNSRRESAELAVTKRMLHHLTECVKENKPFPLHRWSGTSVDLLIVELNKRYVQTTTLPSFEHSKQGVK